MKSESLLHAIGEISDELILASRPAEKKRRLRMRMVWAPAAAVLLVLLLAVGVGAAGHFGSLENLFGPAFPGARADALDPGLIEKLGSPVGVSAEDNGVTVTVDSMIRDRYNCTLVVTVEKDGIDGKGFSFREAAFQAGGAELSGGASSSSDPVSDDGKARYVVSWGSEETIPGGKAAVIFSGLRINTSIPLVEQTIEGRWELELDVDYEDLSVDLPAGQTLSVEGTEVAIDRVTVSPLSIFITYTADLAGASPDRIIGEDSGDTLRRRLDSLTVVLTKKDGIRFINSWTPHPEEDSHFRGSWGNTEQEGGMLNGRLSLVFDQPIPLGELDSVAIEGVEIPLDGLAQP